MSEEQPLQQPGTFAWNELNSAVPETAKAFYTDLFGWTTSELEMPGGWAYTMFMQGQAPVAGLVKPQDSTLSAPTWVSYVNVTHIDQSIAKATELGATLCRDRFDLPSGSFAILKDPEGAMFAL